MTARKLGCFGLAVKHNLQQPVSVTSASELCIPTQVIQGNEFAKISVLSQPLLSFMPRPCIHITSCLVSPEPVIIATSVNIVPTRPAL